MKFQRERCFAEKWGCKIKGGWLIILTREELPWLSRSKPRQGENNLSDGRSLYPCSCGGNAPNSFFLPENLLNFHVFKALLAMFMIGSGAAHADAIRVIDGDGFMLNGREVRLRT